MYASTRIVTIQHSLSLELAHAPLFNSPLRSVPTTCITFPPGAQRPCTSTLRRLPIAVLWIASVCAAGQKHCAADEQQSCDLNMALTPVLFLSHGGPCFFME
jgi:hypothetical protein